METFLQWYVSSFFASSNLLAPYYLYNISTKAITPLANGDAGLQNVAFSENNKYVAFAKACNLYVASATSENVDVKQLTFDGDNNILNGIFDWVYEGNFFNPSKVNFL